jgi:outer membrane biosynthesis protein TonB
MAGTIGIKIANGDFYPITEENSSVKKRLVLTTVHDRQENVQIDLFRSISKSMLDAQYIGSLVIEDIKAKLKGEPSIEMIISSDINGNITADAYDLDSDSEHQTLNVSLKTMDSFAEEDDYPDFNLDENRPAASSSLYDKYDKDEERKFPWLIMGLATLFVVIAVAVLWFLFLGGREVIKLPGGFVGGKPAYEEPPVPSAPPVTQQSQPEQPPEPPLVTQQSQPEQPPEPPPVAQQNEPEQPPEPPLVTQQNQPEQSPPEPPPQPEVEKPQEPPVIRAPSVPPPERAQAAAVPTRPPAPVSSYKVPAVIPPNGIVYQIRWGDTLWEISEAFYRTPWMYPKIAQDNNIKNPDRILSGSTVRIRPLK